MFDWTLVISTSSYRSERQASTVIAIISGLAIAIACLGLFGLAAFVIVHRAKEISIRKVLEASVAGITMQISASFLKWVGIAFPIATPVTWWLTNSWLQNFAYRIPVRGWMFAVAAGVAIGAALLAVGVLALKAASANPVGNLPSLPQKSPDSRRGAFHIDVESGIVCSGNDHWVRFDYLLQRIRKNITD